MTDSYSNIVVTCSDNTLQFYYVFHSLSTSGGGSGDLSKPGPAQPTLRTSRKQMLTRRLFFLKDGSRGGIFRRLGKACSDNMYAAFIPKPGGAVTGSCYRQGCCPEPTQRGRGGGHVMTLTSCGGLQLGKTEAEATVTRVGGRDYGKDDFIAVSLAYPHGDDGLEDDDKNSQLYSTLLSLGSVE